MRKNVLLIVVTLVAVAIPSGIAAAEKFRTAISAHTTEDQDRIFGVVRSRDFACEKRREVRLYGPANTNGGGGNTVTKGGQEFARYDLELTNRFGEYAFESFFVLKQGGFGFQSGEYFTRALRKDFPGDVCRRRDSRIVFINARG